MTYLYKVSVTGGTFDRLHRGHKALLDAAFTQSEKVIVGIATSKLHQHKSHASLIESYIDREETVVEYLKQKNYLPRASIVPIDDMYGNTLTEKTTEAIFFTESNKENVARINEERALRGLKQFALEEIDLCLATDGKPISSERIRNGEIDRDGTSYQSMFAKELYNLPQTARDFLRKPFGTVYEDVESLLLDHGNAMIIAVGDVVSLSFYKLERQAAISVVDLKTRRNALNESDIDIFYSLPSLKPARNTAGTIELNAVERLKDALDVYKISQEHQTIVVAGEEDLLTIPAILLAPLGAVVVYGLYGKGAIAVEVTEEKKKEFAEIFGMFT